MHDQDKEGVAIDACISYVEDKNAFFLAKEGYVVYFDSPTGHKADYVWHSHTITETLRIIKTTRLTSKSILLEGHLISALQELGRVYEFGVRAKSKVKAGVFNYYEHATTTVGDMAMIELASLLIEYEYVATFIGQVTSIFLEATAKIGCKIKSTECRRLMVKHAEQAGFVVRVGPNRVLVDGKKQGCLMVEASKPKEVRAISDEDYKQILGRLVAKIK